MEHLAGQTYNELNTILENNKPLVKQRLKKQIQLFTSLFDAQQSLVKNHIGGILDPYYDVTPTKQVLLQSYFKNSDLLLTSNNLIIQGHYGASMIIMRQIFEFLLIGKYSFITEKEGFINRWLDGKQVNAYDEIIKKLINPDKKDLHNFWVMICNFAHATTFSNQSSLNYEENKLNIQVAYHILLILLCCNYHLLSNCVIDQKLIYRSNTYGNHKKENTSLKINAKGIIAEIRKDLSPDGIMLINVYCKSWKY